MASEALQTIGLIKKTGFKIWALRWLLLLNVFLLSPILLYNINFTEVLHQSSNVSGLFYLGTSILWLLTLQFFFRPAWLLHLFLLPFYVITAVELFLIFNFDTRLTSSYIGILMGELGHAEDFLSVWGNQVFIASAALIIFFAFTLLRTSKIKARFSRAWVIFPLAGLIFIYSGLTYRTMQNFNFGIEKALKHTLAFDKSLPFGVLGKFYTVHNLLGENRQAQLERKDFNFGAYKSKNSDLPELHVLVIGESARPDRWEINNYTRSTNPVLKDLQRVIFFPNAIAEVALTSQSVPLILTRSSVGENYNAIDTQIREKSIISAFKEVGYKTHWLSTVQLDEFIGDITNFSKEADKRRFFEWRYDGVLFNSLDDILAERNISDDLFIVLHTQGSHFDFNKRYPKEFIKFPEGPELSYKEYLNNTYDNSILYTDYFLGQVVKRLEAFPGISTLTYISDHGENLLDDDREIFGHVINNEYDLPTAMLFWSSESFFNSRTKKFQAINNNATKPITTASIFPTLLDIAEIKVPSTDMSKSLANNAFLEYPRIVLKDERPVDYDEWYATLSIKKTLDQMVAETN